MSYIYKSIKDLEPGYKTQNFYGKIVFIAKKDDRIVLLLKDETKSMFLWLKATDGQELKFHPRQVIRVHRCSVKATPNSKQGFADIGVSGCHLIAWPQFGNVNEPIFISSRTWTKSTEDRERLEALSNLDRTSRETDANEIARKLIEHREKPRVNLKVTNWWNKVKIQSGQTLLRNAKESHNNQPGTVVESKK